MSTLHEPYEICPYNPTHQILKKRMQIHLTKCRKQHQNTTKKTCPFNTTHVHDKMEMQAHIQHCENSLIVHTDRYEMQPQRTIGLPVNKIVNLDIPKSTEDWDKEPAPVNSYNPEEHIKNLAIIQTKMVASKSERRKFRLAERERFQSLEKNSNKPQPSTSSVSSTSSTAYQDLDITKPLRVPQRSAKSALSGTSVTKSSAADSSCTNKKNKTPQDKLNNSFDEISAELSNISISKTRHKSVLQYSEIAAKTSNSFNKVVVNNPFEAQSLKLRSTGRGCNRINNQENTKMNPIGEKSKGYEYKTVDENAMPFHKDNRKF